MVGSAALSRGWGTGAWRIARNRPPLDHHHVADISPPAILFRAKPLDAKFLNRSLAIGWVAFCSGCSQAFCKALREFSPFEFQLDAEH
jgi:hypothetical protein